MKVPPQAPLRQLPDTELHRLRESGEVRLRHETRPWHRDRDRAYLRAVQREIARRTAASVSHCET